MLHPSHTDQTDSFIVELDAAVESHMNWTRRILWCAVLHTIPDEDIMSPTAHTICHFGHWLGLNMESLKKVDSETTSHIEKLHQTMHDAIRSICADVMSGTPGKETDLQAFEHAQSGLLTSLARLKTLYIFNMMRHDPLTGLPLRHGIERDLELCLKNAKRSHAHIYVALIDVDHFKRINDEYGHMAGDMVLRHLADTLKLSLRDSEPLYRFGGEEFLWLIRCDTADEAAKAANRIMSAVSASHVSIENMDTPITLTITIGLACVGENEAFSSAINRADAALYRGKNGGRNCFVIAD